MRIFLYKYIMEPKDLCAICAFFTKIMRDFPFLCANCAPLILSLCRFNIEKVRMDYSCHCRYEGIHIVFNLFSLLSSQNKPRTASKLSTFCLFRWSQSIVFKKG